MFTYGNDSKSFVGANPYHHHFTIGLDEIPKYLIRALKDRLHDDDDGVELEIKIMEKDNNGTIINKEIIFVVDQQLFFVQINYPGLKKRIHNINIYKKK